MKGKMETKFHNHLADGTRSQHWRNKKKMFKRGRVQGAPNGWRGRPSVLAGGMDDGDGGGECRAGKATGCDKAARGRSQCFGEHGAIPKR